MVALEKLIYGRLSPQRLKAYGMALEQQLDEWGVSACPEWELPLPTFMAIRLMSSLGYVLSDKDLRNWIDRGHVRRPPSDGNLQWDLEHLFHLQACLEVRRRWSAVGPLRDRLTPAELAGQLCRLNGEQAEVISQYSIGDLLAMAINAHSIEDRGAIAESIKARLAAAGVDYD